MASFHEDGCLTYRLISAATTNGNNVKAAKGRVNCWYICMQRHDKRKYHHDSSGNDNDCAYKPQHCRWYSWSNSKSNNDYGRNKLHRGGDSIGHINI